MKSQPLPSYLTTDNKRNHWFPTKGFCISYNTNTLDYEVQKIDEIAEIGKTDDDAKIEAIKMGYKFEDASKPYKVTNKGFKNKQ